MNLDTWVKLRKQLKTYYTFHGPANAFALWNMIRNVLDPHHEVVRQTMGEAIAVDGSGSPPSMQIIFSAICEQMEGHYTSRGRRGLTGRCGQAPWQAPAPSTQTFKNLSNVV